MHGLKNRFTGLPTKNETVSRTKVQGSIEFSVLDKVV